MKPKIDVNEEQFDEKREVISQFKEENERLKKIIAKELSENDELGSEFVYVTILKDCIEQQAEIISEMKAGFKELSDSIDWYKNVFNGPQHEFEHWWRVELQGNYIDTVLASVAKMESGEK